VCVLQDGGVLPDSPAVAADAPPVTADTAGDDLTDALASDVEPITCESVTYPLFGFYGTNALHPAVSDFVSYRIAGATTYELAADLAAGTTVTVKITMTPETLKNFRASLGLDGAPPPPFDTGVWLLSDGQGWLISTFSRDTGEQVFLSQSGVLRPERQIGFSGSGEARIDYYECNSIIPTRSKMIRWKSAPEPGDGGAGDGGGDTRG
jgi:hypothetical protein